MKASIIELPETVKYGTMVVEKAGLSDRIRYITGNLLESDWGSSYRIFDLMHFV
ncbi:hypothetical protein [Iningainema tapete]|uniref:Uncharacterized protein n=1 Tax=Iningainema tapete BLCC-T55 TaxID=2748662 RepID=A0A8J7CD91_9CYAN|nr:hypothetical protein [Iningainema tapete]MBD2772725.1 hypothetical protein [Iningainema tapete BLCC-T55]